MGKKAIKPKPVSKLADLAEASGEFRRIFYGGSSGCQPGSWVTVLKEKLEAKFRVEAEPRAKSIGYNPLGTERSRITYLLIHRTDSPIYYGPWDSKELSGTNYHSFENDPQDVRDLSRLIVKYFSR